MTSQHLLNASADAAVIAFGCALLLAAVALIKGPTLPHRVLALELMTSLAAGFIAAYAVAEKQTAYLDVAVALGIIGFLTTVALARYIVRRDQKRKIT